jgi:trans-aconitate methyltransferase
MADLLDRFFDRTGRPDSFAAVGCGPADCPLELADRHPTLDVHAYDATESAVCEARERTAERDLSNVTVESATLPAFDPGRTFDVVYCYAVVHYVENVERAIRELYDAVAPGGSLVFNYPNRITRAEWDRESTGDGVLADNPAFRERFALLLDARNLLSYERIADALGTRPRSFWSAADAEEYWAREDTPPEVRTGFTDAAINPCVYVPK